MGFEFRASSSDKEIERTNRFQFEKGVLVPNKKGQSIMLRQVHFNPILDLYLTNLQLRSAFESPGSTPCFGRSQDIAWIEFVRNVDLYPVDEGEVGPTLLPRPFPIKGLILRLPEWMENDRTGYIRKPGPFGFYMSGSPADPQRMHVRGPGLYHPSDSTVMSDVVYIHEWIKA